MTMTFDGTTGITFPDGQTQDVGIPDPGTNGNVLTSNGTIWISTAPSSNGANLSSINASNLTSGTVATARLASGTANSSTYLRGDSTWAALSAPNNGVLTLNTSGTGLSGSQTFSADQASNVTFTVTSNANSANGASTIVARDAGGNFSAATITATTFSGAHSGSGAGLTGIPNSALTNSAITINGTSTALGGSISVGTVTSVNATAGTGISVSGGPITSSGSITITNSGVTSLTAGSGISLSGSTGGVTISASGGGVTSLNGQTGAVTTTSFDAIGSVALLGNVTTTRLTAGTTIAGTSLRYATTATLIEPNNWFNEGNPSAGQPWSQATNLTFFRFNNSNTGYQIPANSTTVSGTWRALHLIPERNYDWDGSNSRTTTFQGLFVRVS